MGARGSCGRRGVGSSDERRRPNNGDSRSSSLRLARRWRCWRSKRGHEAIRGGSGRQDAALYGRRDAGRYESASWRDAGQLLIAAVPRGVQI